MSKTGNCKILRNLWYFVKKKFKKSLSQIIQYFTSRVLLDERWLKLTDSQIEILENVQDHESKNNIFNNTFFHTLMHFLVLAWAIDRCANILPGKKWSPRRASAQLEKGNSSHLLIKHVLQRFATQFCRPNEFEDDWNKH